MRFQEAAGAFSPHGWSVNVIHSAFRFGLTGAAVLVLAGCGSAASPRWAGGRAADPPPAETTPMAETPSALPGGSPSMTPPVPRPEASADPARPVVQPGATTSEVQFQLPALAPAGPGYGYRIGVGDELSVSIPYEPTYTSTNVVVRPDGMISTSLVQNVRAAGRTASELDSTLESEYGKLLRHPVVRVSVLKISGNVVYCIGEVGSPVTAEVGGGMTLLQLLARAGGIKHTGSDKSVLVLHREAGNQVIARRYNVGRIMEGRPDSPDVTLAPTDIVYVPRTFIAKLDQWVDQYVNQFVGAIATSYLKGWELIEPSRFFYKAPSGSTTTTPSQSPGTGGKQ